MTRTVPLLLVVDDNDAAAGVLSSELTEAGYEVVRATDGRDGLASFQHCDPDRVGSLGVGADDILAKSLK